MKKLLLFLNKLKASFSLDFNNIATDFTFTRASTATYVDEFGVIREVEGLGVNVIKNGDFSNGSTDWALFTGVNITGGELVANVAPFTSIAGQPNVIPETKFVQLKFDTVVNSGTLRLLVGSGGDVTEVTATGSYTFNVNSGTGGNFALFGRSGGFDGTIDNISVKEIIRDDIPRIDYSDGTAAFLLEPESTNLLLHSLDFTQSVWAKRNGATVTTDTVTFDGSSGSGMRQVVSVDPTKTYTLSFTVSGTEQNIVMEMVDNGDGSDSNPITIPVTSTPTKHSLTVDFNPSTTFGGALGIYLNRSNSAIAGSTVTFHSMQVEELNYATSYIPTSGSTVTRAEETCINGGSADVINSEKGVLFLDVAALDDDLTDREVSLSDNTTTNKISVGYNTTTNQIEANVIVGGVSQAALTYTASDITSFSKIAFKYALNDFALWVDGTERATDVSGSVFSASTLDRINFNEGDASGAEFYGKTKALKIYDRALSDAKLERLTFPDLGSELINNGDFENGTTGWTNASSSTFEVADGGSGFTTALHLVVGAINRGAFQSVFTVGKNYFVSLDLRVVSGSVYFGINTNKLNNTNYSNSSWQTVSGNYTATDDKIRLYGNEAAEFYIDNISVKEIL